MWTRPFILAIVLILLPGALPRSASGAPGRETEEQLLARIQRERNLVKKAKYEIRLGQMKLQQAIEVYNQGNLELGAQLLAAHLERMRSSWQTLRHSGRNAARQPQGFKELEIALRVEARPLADLTRRVPYFYRSPIEKVAEEIEQLRTEVIQALFPPERPPARKKGR